MTIKNREKSYCGYVAIVGRPNVGKSTLLNRILGQKISITARKPQTTRHKIYGIKTIGNAQAIYVDTPGFHRGQKRQLNRCMLQAIRSALAEVDIIVFVLDGLHWQEEDEMMLESCIKTEKPIILVVNKTDYIKDKNRLLPHLNSLNGKNKFATTIPLSAKKDNNIEALEKAVADLLPESSFFFAEDEITDKSTRFLVAEIIREKLTRLLGQELPHELTVTIEKFDEQEKIVNISALIYVERPGQKTIVIGKDGAKLKEVGSKARLDMERLLEKKVFLQLWVKVKSGWSDDLKLLNSLGYV
ncbi:MAG: GTPase Era [Gammaproteobacteria bacterium]|nr:GTPase Era [Gammaproteobacteria bacterium]